MTEKMEWCLVVWDMGGAPATAGSGNWSTVAVALISGLIGIGGSWLALGWQARRESRSVRAAIFAEVEALLELAERSRFSEKLQEAFVRSSFGDISQLRLSIPEHYNRVYLANAPKLGVLKEKEARGVVRFYQLMDSLRDETSEGGYLYGGTRRSDAFASAERTFSLAEEIGKSLIIG